MQLSRLAEGATARFPFLYFSMRVGMLGLTFLALAAWAFTGFNVVEGGVPLIGIQWSTFATFTFFFYLLMVNFQTGGLRSLRQLSGGLRMDLHFLTTLKRREYPQEAATNPWRAVIVSTLVCISALFAFEVVWVFFYDWFQFGSLFWPVYYAHTALPVVFRNVGLFVLPAILAALVLTTPLDFTKNRSIISFRTEGAGLMILLAGGMWLEWVGMPHQIVNVSALASAQIIGPAANTFSLSNCYVWPAQNLFPQNTYTFYPCALKGVSYTPPQILGFFCPDNAVHAVNVLTKFVTFAAVCYPFMAFVRRLD